MTWYAPFTFVAGNTLTAEELNKYLYHNMNETLAGKLNAGVISDAEGTFFSTDGGLPNSVVGYSAGYTDYKPARAPYGNITSTGYSNPVHDSGAPPSFGTYVNPTITLTTGTKALVYVQVQDLGCGTTNFNGGSTFLSVAVSGATTIAASDSYSIRASGIYPQTESPGFVRSTIGPSTSMFRWFTTLNPGSNTFTLKGRIVSTSTQEDASVKNPSMLVIPFG